MKKKSRFKLTRSLLILANLVAKTDKPWLCPSQPEVQIFDALKEGANWHIDCL